MAETTVRELAESVGIPVDRLLAQLGESGLPHRDADQPINDSDKAQLLSHLRRLHGRGEGETAAPRRIGLRRKSVSELKVASRTGRRKTVTVEVRKRRTVVRPPGEAGAAEDPGAEPAGAPPAGVEETRRALVEEARRRQEELDESLRAEAEVREKAEQIRRLTPVERRKRREPEPEPAEPEAPAEEPAAAPQPEPEPAPAAAALSAEQDQLAAQQAALAAAQKPEARKTERPPKRAERKRRGRQELHVAASKSGRRPKKAQARTVVRQPSRHGFERPTAPVVRDVPIPETITVGDLAQRMSLKASDLIKAMMNLGVMANINQLIDQETAALVVEELGHRPKLLKENALEDEVLQSSEEQREALPRPPVVTVMGHVDHGKTSLLDSIRRSRVVAGEAGGITQHIGAYRVETDHGLITFLDTPGHAAFTAMRARGAQATDIVVLVVAADDGVMPQTVEAIQHAKAAGVPVIVAINKIDRPDADPQRIRQELANHELIPEDWGGDTMTVHCSAKTGDGVDAVLEAILLQAELLELRAPVTGPARGIVIESRLDRTRGAVATVLVQSGCLRKGDILLAGKEYGRVRGLFDERGASIKEATPSVPVEVLGLSGPPNAGDQAVTVADERKAREIALFRQGKYREGRLVKRASTKLDDVFSQMAGGGANRLNIVLKADVQGSVEALREALIKLSHEEVKVEVISAATGGISEADVNLAIASKAIIIGFNVRADGIARRLIESGGVDVHYFSVIYDVIDTVKQAISGMLSPEIREQIVGLAEVREVYRSRKFGAVAGCMVLEGTVRRHNPIRVLRDNVVIYEGELESLRRFKEDVSEVKAGTECGIGVKNYNDVKPGDQIEVYERVELERKL